MARWLHSIVLSRSGIASSACPGLTITGDRVTIRIHQAALGSSRVTSNRLQQSVHAPGAAPIGHTVAGKGVEPPTSFKSPGDSVEIRLHPRYVDLQDVLDRMHPGKSFFNTIVDNLERVSGLLAEMQAKVERSGDPDLTDAQRMLLTRDVILLREEIGVITAGVSLNGVKLLGSTTTFTFPSGESTSVEFRTASFHPQHLGMANISALSSIDVISPETVRFYRAEVSQAQMATSDKLEEASRLLNQFIVQEGTIRVQQGRFSTTVERIGHSEEALREIPLVRSQVMDDVATAVAAQSNIHGRAILDLL